MIFQSDGPDSPVLFGNLNKTRQSTHELFEPRSRVRRSVHLYATFLDLFGILRRAKKGTFPPRLVDISDLRSKPPLWASCRCVGNFTQCLVMRFCRCSNLSVRFLSYNLMKFGKYNDSSKVKVFYMDFQQIQLNMLFLVSDNIDRLSIKPY